MSPYFIEYIDGNANRFSLKEFTLVYKPVSRQESSTGMYSGGEPAETRLNTAQLNALNDLVKNAQANKSVQIKDRVKGSGLIELNNGRFILAPESNEKKVIETLLRTYLGIN